MKSRVTSLDVIRGFALIGVLLVNAAYFAAPQWSAVNPTIEPLSVASGGVWSWFGPYALFEYKSIGLFSILFGASILMVGGTERHDERSRRVRRRLFWLALIGVLHGAIIWFGDILLSYAIIGLLLLKARRWRPRTQMCAGLALFLLSMGILGAIAAHIANLNGDALAAFKSQSWSPPSTVVAAAVQSYQTGLAASLGANLQAWVDQQLQLILFLSFRTAGLMLIGMSLYTSGFLTGKSHERIYRIWAVLGALCLTLSVWNAAEIARSGFDLVRTQSVGTLVTASTALPIAIGYASALTLLVRAERLTVLTNGLAAVGRMSLTNYILQSLVMTSIFWSGRGLGLFGELSRPAVILIAMALFVIQMLVSKAWLARYERGPLESVWHRLTVRGQSGSGCEPLSQFRQQRVPHAIESTSLNRSYGEHHAVSDLNLQVPVGSIYGFLGPNGAGKTTTIRMLLGLTRPSSGQAWIFGKNVQSDRISAARLTGALVESRATWDHLTGRDNLEIVRRLMGLGSRETDRVLNVVGLGAQAHRKVGHYSLGMRQRLGLAKALLGSPKLLVLDEPMNGLDPDGVAEMRETILGLSASGITVFLSSHILPEVQALATHIGLMRDGHLVKQGAIRDLLSSASPDLLVRLDDPARAQVILGAIGKSVEQQAEGRLLIRGAGNDDSTAEIVAVLVKNGLKTFELGLQPMSLSQFWNENRTGDMAA